MLRTLLLIASLSVISATASAAPVSRDDPESADPGAASISTASISTVRPSPPPRASAAALATLNAGVSGGCPVTAQAVLAVVEPRFRLGGGFLLHQMPANSSSTR